MYISGHSRRRRCPLHGDYCYDPRDPARCPLFYESAMSGLGHVPFDEDEGGISGFGNVSGRRAARVGSVAAATDARGTLYEIPDSDEGTEITVQEMANLVKKGMLDPFVIKNAMRVVRAAGVPRKAYLKEIEMIFRYAQGTHPTLPGLRYFKDTWHAEKLQSAKRTEEFGGSDCDDLVIWCGSHLLAIGHGPVRLVVVAADPGRPEEFSHVYLWVKHPDGNAVDPEDQSRWIPLDPTVGKPMGWEIESPFRKSYYEVRR